METKYLYGASVQGIQSFIFQTNKLKEIAGASELVEKICTDEFRKFAGNGIPIVMAAGNIKFIFDKKEDCEKAVLEFPKHVMEMAPSVTISQAVVLMNSEKSFDQANQELEIKLKTQKNKPVRSLTLGLAVTKRAPATGLPATSVSKGEFVDEATEKKIEQYNQGHDSLALVKKAFGKDVNEKQITDEIDKIAGKNNWIAVIHADGNGLGNIVSEVGKNERDLFQFSSKLNEITEIAAKNAFQSIGGMTKFEDTVIPIRPILLGGDDLTLICRADLSIEYTRAFLESFEEESKKQLNEIKWENKAAESLFNKGLTACAGIAFVKTTYPFHYAVTLSEKLCKRAKKGTKKVAKEVNETLAPSCLMFHKVQDSFAEDFEEIVKRELKPQPYLTFEFGPYYCGAHAKSIGEKCENTIEILQKNANQLQSEEGSAIKSNVRQWLNLLVNDINAANQKMKRIRKLNSNASNFIDSKYENIRDNENSGDKEIKIPFYDILSIVSIKEEEKQ